jgi:hypothetical protein
MSWWTDPSSKHAFILSWVSAVLTAGAAAAGLIFFMVRMVAVKSTDIDPLSLYLLSELGLTLQPQPFLPGIWIRTLFGLWIGKLRGFLIECGGALAILLPGRNN